MRVKPGPCIGKCPAPGARGHARGRGQGGANQKRWLGRGSRWASGPTPGCRKPPNEALPPPHVGQKLEKSPWRQGGPSRRRDPRRPPCPGQGAQTGRGIRPPGQTHKKSWVGGGWTLRATGLGCSTLSSVGCMTRHRHTASRAAFPPKGWPYGPGVHHVRAPFSSIPLGEQGYWGGASQGLAGWTHLFGGAFVRPGLGGAYWTPSQNKGGHPASRQKRGTLRAY